MILEPECIGCLFNQILRAFKTVEPNVSREIIISAQKKLMDYLIKADINKISAPIVGKFAYNLVASMLGVKDPYRFLKDKYNRLALKYYDEVKEIVENAEDPLFEAIAAAALGNTVDFAGQHQIDLINDIRNFSPNNLKINDYKEFKKSLEIINKNRGNLLLLLDNAGEIVFDKLFVITLQKLYPDLKIICSVRSEPIINDVTMEDAEFVGLTQVTKIIKAQATPGIDLSTASEEFKDYFFNENGIILSKGQGNFETLYGINVPNKDVYYLLKAKCSLMERIFNVKIGDLIFKKKTAHF
jgi:uncharacterized protein with ATP-grasp and redox domains